jgi:uncharacterized protein YaeQ
VIRTTVRVLAWIGWAFCTFIAFLWGLSGQPGFAALWTVYAFAFVWIIAGCPSPRAIALAFLRSVTGRDVPSPDRIAALERELGVGDDIRGRG